MKYGFKIRVIILKPFSFYDSPPVCFKRGAQAADRAYAVVFLGTGYERKK